MRVIKGILALVVAAALVGACGDKQEEVTVGLIVKRNTNPFWVTMKDTAEATADDDDVKLLTAAGTSDVDNASQVAALASMTAKGAKGIMITPADSTAIVPAIEKARRAGVTVIALDTPTEPESAVDALYATDNQQAGELIGRYAKAKAAERAIKPRIAMLDLAPGITSGDLRHQGFLDGFGIEDGSPEIVGSVETRGEAARAEAGLRALLEKDDGINIVYTVNEPAAFGAAQALKAAGISDDGRDPRLGRWRLRSGQGRSQAGRHRRHRAAVPREHGALGRRRPCRRGARRPQAGRVQEHGRGAHHRRRGERRALQGRRLRRAQLLGLTSPRPIALDQRVGRGVVRELRLVGPQLGGDPLGQHLAELDAPLVERVDVPDRALREDAVLVERDELAERARASAGRPGACSTAGCPRTSRCGTSASGVPSAAHLLGRLAERQRLGLREDVGHQQVVMLAERVERLREADEVARDQLRALVDQLVEGVLPVGARLAPVDRRRSRSPPRAPSSVTRLPLLSIVSCCR